MTKNVKEGLVLNVVERALVLENTFCISEYGMCLKFRFTADGVVSLFLMTTRIRPDFSQPMLLFKSELCNPICLIKKFKFKNYVLCKSDECFPKAILE